MNKKNLALLGALLLAAPHAARADRIWWDGSRDEEDAPPGKLLSDNGGYWGEGIATGVDYSYEAAPDNPGDAPAGAPNTRLLNGIPAGDWNQPVGTANRPIVAIFDFKRACTFAEIDISTRSQRVALKIEVADATGPGADAGPGPWRVAYDRPLAQSPDKMFQRVPLAARPAGRFVRLSVNAVAPERGNYLTYLEEVIAWGDSIAPTPAPPAIQSVAATPVLTGLNLPSIPGAERSSFSDAQFAAWKRSLGARANEPAVWSRVPAWDSITAAPILPAAASVSQPISISMARNETACAAVALTSTSAQNPAQTTVALSTFSRVSSASHVVKPFQVASTSIGGVMRVAGVVATRWSGTNIGPLLESDNMPGPTLLQRYVKNAAGIQDFPRLTLSPGGSAVLWISVSTHGLEPGTYEAILSARSGAAAPVLVAIRVQVLDVTLPQPLTWINSWSGVTGMFPFSYADRTAREVAYKSSLGINVWDELPVAGSVAEAARRAGRTMSHLRLLPPDYVNRGFNNQLKPENLTDKDRAVITDYVRDLVKQTRALGMGYDDWYGELWDEPGRGNAALYGALGRIVKAADPRVRLFMNPIFWEGNASAPDDVIAAALSPYYRELIDISVPHEELLNEHPRSEALFDAPHFIRGSYAVSTHGGKGEASADVEKHRQMAWAAWARGYNGWGFYSYYRPEGSPWDDLDGGLPDYSMVFPGPRGPIATRRSESVRQGWQDFRLLSLLKARGQKADLDAILKAYASGERLDVLRERALRAAAKPLAKAPAKSAGKK